MSLLIPSYAQGFARNAAESANPNLWDRLVGLWAPHLGPTGLTLWDWSGYSNNGVLTNMNPATDWVTSRLGWALNFPDATDRVSASSSESLSQWTLWALIRPTGGWSSAEAADDYLLEVGLDANNRAFIYLNDDGAIRHLSVSGVTVRIAATAQTSWNEQYYSVVGTSDGSLIRVYVDGVVGSTTAAHQGLGTIPTVTLGYDGIEDEGRGLTGRIAIAGIWSRALVSSEIQHLFRDPHALTRLRSQPYAVPAAAAVGNPWYYYQQQTAAG